jgi:hypothetical protein
MEIGMDDRQLREITKRLDVLINLTLQGVGRDGRHLPLRDQIRILSELGFRPVDIAGTLSKTAGFINKELTLLRKSKNQSRS